MSAYRADAGVPNFPCISAAQLAPRSSEQVNIPGSPFSTLEAREA